MYNFIRHFRDYLRLRKAIIMADERHAQDSDRYYVVPSMDGQLLIMDRKNFRLMKRKHYIAQETTLNDLRRMCFYHTPYSNGSDSMPDNVRKERAEMYYQWAVAKRKEKKHGRR